MEFADSQGRGGCETKRPGSCRSKINHNDDTDSDHNNDDPAAAAAADDDDDDDDDEKEMITLNLFHFILLNWAWKSL